MKISTEYYSPQFFTEGPNEMSRTMFGDADIQGNLKAGFSYQDILKFLDTNPKTLSTNNQPKAIGGVYEKVSLGAQRETEQAAREAEQASRQRELDNIASESKAEQERLAAEQQRRLQELEIASRTAQQNQLAGSRTAQLQLQSVSRLPGAQSGTGAFKRRALEIKPQKSLGLAPSLQAATSSLGINV